MWQATWEGALLHVTGTENLKKGFEMGKRNMSRSVFKSFYDTLDYVNVFHQFEKGIMKKRSKLTLNWSAVSFRLNMRKEGGQSLTTLRCLERSGWRQGAQLSHARSLPASTHGTRNSSTVSPFICAGRVKISKLLFDLCTFIYMNVSNNETTDIPALKH